MPGAGEAEGWQRGWDVAGGHPRFLREAPMPPERPGSQPSPISAARSRELPDRTKGGGSGPVRRTHRRSLRLDGEAGCRKRRAAGGGVGRPKRVHGGKGVCGRIRDTYRCGSLPRHDGSLAARRTRSGRSRKCGRRRRRRDEDLVAAPFIFRDADPLKLDPPVCVPSPRLSSRRAGPGWRRRRRRRCGCGARPWRRGTRPPRWRTTRSASPLPCSC
jgi:hypothetical protein